MPRWREAGAAVLVFTVLTCILTYPQAWQLSTHLGAHYDALFSLWRLAWIAHQLPRDPLRLFDANIFHPAQGTLAYSDAILLPGLIAAPLQWAGVDVVLLYNLLVLGSFVASGLGIYVLVRSATGSIAAAYVSGVIFAFAPYRFAHFPQLELLWAFPIPLAWWALQRACERGRARDGVWLGIFVVLQAWSSIYYAVFLVTSLGLLAVVWTIGRGWAEVRRLFIPAATAVATVVVLVGFYSIPYLENRSEVGVRSEAEIREWSPTLWNYLAVTPENWIYGASTGHLGHLEGTLFPGIAAVVLGVIALWPPYTRARSGYALVLLVAFDASLGFNGYIYPWLYEAVLPYRGLRVPSRMFVIVSGALAVLAGHGLARLSRRSRRPLAPIVVGLLGGAVVVFESVAVPIVLEPVPRVPATYSWLRHQPRTVIVEWPVPRAADLGATSDPLYMYYSTRHWHRLVNGYSGFIPPSYIDFVERASTRSVAGAVEEMRGRGAEYLILHSDLAPAAYVDWIVELESVPGVALMSTEPFGRREIAVYRLRPR